MKKKNASLTLSGGGGLGLAHVGALRILEHRYNFNYYAGVSAGAIVVACHVCGISADEISKIIHEQNFLSFAFESSETNFGFVHGKKVFTLLEKVFQKKTFEEIEEKLGKKLRIYATNFQNGKQICLKSGLISKAVMASLSIPILFDPFQYNGMFLVDGGLSGNFPIQKTLNEYPDECIGIDVATSLDENIDLSKKTFFGKAKGFQSALERTFRIFFASQKNYDETLHRLHVLQPDLSNFKTIDIFKLKEIEKKGEEYAKNFYF